MKVVFGFDPGGAGSFGWAVCAFSPQLPLRLLTTGTAPHAQAAVEAALAHDFGSEVVAAGIDSPLCWTRNGSRMADRRVRRAIVRAGCTTAPGTVQHVNSLRGACLVQGIMAATELRQASPSILISESHPKAALWLMRLASIERPIRVIVAGDIPSLQAGDLLATEHERDAAVGALSGWAAATQPPGWVDLLTVEPESFFPAGPVSYYMPDPDSTLLLD